MRGWPKDIRIVHGSDSAREGLREALNQMADKAGREFKITLPVKA
jgi:metallo-beta-lactamase family protein